MQEIICFARGYFYIIIMWLHDIYLGITLDFVPGLVSYFTLMQGLPLLSVGNYFIFCVDVTFTFKIGLVRGIFA